MKAFDRTQCFRRGQDFRRDMGRAIFLIIAILFPHLQAQPNSSSVNSEPRIGFDCISLEQGLSQSTIYCILQDRKGFLWLGTADGLNRYDGYTFKIYKTGPHGLRNSMIRAIYEDRSGMLWIGTEGGGLHKFDPATERFTCYQFDPNDPRSLSNNYVWSICEDHAGNLWIGTDGGGLSRLGRDDG